MLFCLVYYICVFLYILKFLKVKNAQSSHKLKLLFPTENNAVKQPVSSLASNSVSL